MKAANYQTAWRTFRNNKNRLLGFINAKGYQAAITREKQLDGVINFNLDILPYNTQVYIQAAHYWECIHRQNSAEMYGGGLPAWFKMKI